MPLQDTPSSERIRIAFLGLRNAGKSSLMNAFAAQNVSLVSDVAGTTTDPVKKTMELLPLGPVLLTDTAGLDDDGALGLLRVQKTVREIETTDMAVLVLDSPRAVKKIEKEERDLIQSLRKKNIPFVVALNKCDALDDNVENLVGTEYSEYSESWNLRERLLNSARELFSEKIIFTSAATGEGIDTLKNALAQLGDSLCQKYSRRLLADFVKAGDIVVLVIPIDAAAPKGRLILPQQMALRDALDAGAVPLCCKSETLQDALKKLQEKPALVVTDSQAFSQVDAIVPKEIPLTSFSILMARYKGTLEYQINGAAALDELRDGDTVLISEGCTHHRQCGDIGTEKIPELLRKYTKKNLSLSFTSGASFDSSFDTPGGSPKLVIHCGGCMLSQNEMSRRVAECRAKGVPVTNYGMAIAKMSGILERALLPLRRMDSEQESGV